MYIYSPEKIIPARIKEAEAILKKVKAKHAFITGSFLYKKQYNDIDLFIVTRSKKIHTVDDKRVDIHLIHPNRTSTLFYHSATKLCVSKSILPKQQLRVVLTSYWAELNWCLTPLKGYELEKETRGLVLATNYHEGCLLDSEELSNIRLTTQEQVDAYGKTHAPAIFKREMSKSYRKRYFAGAEKHYDEAAPIIPALAKIIYADRVET